jgi:hypothetical protein
MSVQARVATKTTEGTRSDVGASENSKLAFLEPAGGIDQELLALALVVADEEAMDQAALDQQRGIRFGPGSGLTALDCEISPAKTTVRPQVSAMNGIKRERMAACRLEGRSRGITMEARERRRRGREPLTE